MSKKSPKIAALIADLHGQARDAHYLGFFACFNRQLFYEAHDVLEELWLAQGIMRFSLGAAPRPAGLPPQPDRLVAMICDPCKRGRQAGSNSHFDSERAHPGRSRWRIQNSAGDFEAFLASGPAAAWKAALHLRQNENCWQAGRKPQAPNPKHQRMANRQTARTPERTQ
jgi:hypothetical protein